MDSSTRLDYLTGNLRIEHGEITTQEWVELFWHVFKICKSRIKYLTGFHPVAYFANCSIGKYDRRCTPPHVFKFVGDITVSDEYTKLCSLPEKEDAVELSKRGYIEYRFLLLTKTGKIVSWHTKCRREKIFNQGFRGHREAIQEVAEICIFTELDPAAINGLIGEMSRKDSTYPPFNLILEFASLVDKTAYMAQQRADEWHAISKDIRLLASRIDGG